MLHTLVLIPRSSGDITDEISLRSSLFQKIGAAERNASISTLQMRTDFHVTKSRSSGEIYAISEVTLQDNSIHGLSASILYARFALFSGAKKFRIHSACIQTCTPQRAGAHRVLHEKLQVGLRVGHCASSYFLGVADWLEIPHQAFAVDRK